MAFLKTLWRWLDDRTGLSKTIEPLTRHPVPPESASLRRGWWYLFGIATLTAFLVQIITGIGLAFQYVPSPANAYDSLGFITSTAPLGRLLRGIHYFGASAMIIFIGLHMARVFLTGSYKFPREVNWLSGVALMGLTLVMGFTGQTLRWDQDGIWSLIVGAEQAGRVPWIGAWLAHFLLAGPTINGETLTRIFAFHVLLVPGVIIGILALHLYLVIHNGISEAPRSGRPVDPKTYRAWYHNLVEQHGVPYFPDAAWHEMLAGVGLIVLLVVLAATFGPPAVGNPPDLTAIEAQPRPDWYFLWIYALFALMRPEIERWVIFLGPLIAGAVVVLLPFVANKGERSPMRRPWAIGIVIVVFLSVGTFWHTGAVAPWSPKFDAQPLSATQIGSTNPQIVTGARLFHDEGCEYCHKVAGQGGTRGPDLTDVADRLSSGDITVSIAAGPGNMPSYLNQLTPDQMQAIVAFLESKKTR